MNRTLSPRIPRPASFACRNLFGALLAIGLVLQGAVTVAASPANYARFCEPKITPAFVPLPPGSVEPSDWLRDWAVAAREGITGHLDEDHAVFADAWKGFKINAPNAAPDGTGCPTVLCCVGAVNRILPNYILHLWMATHDNGLAATLYGPCTVSALAGPRVPVKLTTTTNYPFDESIRIKVDPEKDVEFPLYLRIPGWCKRAQIAIRGAPLHGTPDDKGFVRIARTWSKGDIVELVSVHESERPDTSTTRKRVGTSALARQLTRLRIVIVSALLPARERLRPWHEALRPKTRTFKLGKPCFPRVL